MSYFTAFSINLVGGDFFFAPFLGAYPEHHCRSVSVRLCVSSQDILSQSDPVWRGLWRGTQISAERICLCIYCIRPLHFKYTSVYLHIFLTTFFCPCPTSVSCCTSIKPLSPNFSEHDDIVVTIYKLHRLSLHIENMYNNFLYFFSECRYHTASFSCCLLFNQPASGRQWRWPYAPATSSYEHRSGSLSFRLLGEKVASDKVY